MKIRQGFVSNSSSSSFIVTDTDHKGWKILKESDSDAFTIIGEDVNDEEDNGVWCFCWDNDITWDEFLYQTNFDG